MFVCVLVLVSEMSLRMGCGLCNTKNGDRTLRFRVRMGYTQTIKVALGII